MKRVAVIGAGVAGLPAIKQCLEEGLHPVCYEMRDGIGGLWRYTDELVDNQGCVMNNTVTNTPKEQTSYSDFLFPKEFPNFLKHSKYLEYLELYAKHFDLLKHIHFHTKVLKVAPSGDYDATGQWDLKVSGHQ